MKHGAAPKTIFATLTALLVGCGAARPLTSTGSEQRARRQTFADPATEQVFADPDRKKKLEAAFPEIDRMIEAEMVAQSLPGMVFGIVIDGEMPYAKGFGVSDLVTNARPDADTIYRIGSITKSITALAVLSLRDEGKLGLEDPISRWIPEADGLVYPTSDAERANLLQLLTHTSGLPEFGKFDLFGAERAVSEGEIVASLSGFPVENAPGTTCAYSNLGYALLGIVASRAAKRPFREVVRDRILDPLGMRSTAWDTAILPDKNVATPYAPGPSGALTKQARWRFGAAESAGGLYSTLRDMGRYVAFQLAAYPARSEPERGPIRRSSVRESHQHALTMRDLDVSFSENVVKGEWAVDARVAAYGLGWKVVTTCDFDAIVQHPGHGEGSITQLAFLPGRGVGVIAITNVNGPHVALGRVTERALKAMLKTGALQRRSLDPRMATGFAPAMARWLGVYNAWDDGAYAAMLAEGRPRIPAEKAEIVGYHTLHGACTGYTPIEIVSRNDARFLMTCERGKLEIEISTHPKDGMILSFEGTSRDIPSPPNVTAIAGRLAGLIQTWNERVYVSLLAPNTTTPRAEIVARLDSLRSRHGLCTLGAYARKGKTHEFTLTCDKGGDVKLVLGLDEASTDTVTQFQMEELATGSCPVK